MKTCIECQSTFQDHVTICEQCGIVLPSKYLKLLPSYQRTILNTNLRAGQNKDNNMSTFGDFIHTIKKGIKNLKEKGIKNMYYYIISNATIYLCANFNFSSTKNLPENQYIKEMDNIIDWIIDPSLEENILIITNGKYEVRTKELTHE